MGLPLEKDLSTFVGLTMRMKQVFDPRNLGPVDEDAFYFIQAPLDPSKEVPSAVAERLPLVIPIQTPDWYFIHTEGRTWEEHLASLKTSHAKKLRRYSRKPAKYGYKVAVESPRKLSVEKIQRCYDLLCETMTNNSDSDFYTKQSFTAYLRSLTDGVLVAKRADGRVLGFYSGAVIGHDHAPEYRSWGVYHNLFMEYARREFRRGAVLVDLGNTNDDFKQELGGKGRTVCFELRSGMSLRSALGLGCWAVGSMVPEDSFLRRAIGDKDWRILALLLLAALLAVVLGVNFIRPALQFRLLDVALLLGLGSVLFSRVFGGGGGGS